MKIENFIKNYKNHPILFLGTGMSLRYLEQSYTWDGLLQKISFDLYENEEKYLDIKSNCFDNGNYDYAKIANYIEHDFNNQLQIDRNGKFEQINDIFYEKMRNGINLSRFKIYISTILSSLETIQEKQDEINELKKTRKNIGSIITTNYDMFIEQTFEFSPLIGNDILLSNPYGSVYKIHGCVSDPEKIIINDKDYSQFEIKYELIRAQLLSLFIHNPIIFIGYSVGDNNIKNILKTIYTYVKPNTELAKRIRENFLLVEYEKDSVNDIVVEHDIEIEGISTIRINKIKTDDFTSIYRLISNLSLPVTAMDIRKVQSVVKEIYSGGEIKVSITEDINGLRNSDRILAIGSSKTISYQYQNSAETIMNYFKIIEESNSAILKLIDKYTIQSNQFFPIFGFSLINKKINSANKLKKQQTEKLQSNLHNIKENCKITHNNIQSILEDDLIVKSNKDDAIFWLIMNDKLDLDEVENYLREREDKKESKYRKLLCAYDFKKYSNIT